MDMKETPRQSSVFLTYLFNQSLATGELTDDWRLANIFALHKKGPKENAENYRPISLICVCSKVMEHNVHSQVSRFLNNHHILCPNQRGFRPGRSCETRDVNGYTGSQDPNLLPEPG